MLSLKMFAALGREKARKSMADFNYLDQCTSWQNPSGCAIRAT
jgi:hypothetical protein